MVCVEGTDRGGGVVRRILGPAPQAIQTQSEGGGEIVSALGANGVPDLELRPGRVGESQLLGPLPSMHLGRGPEKLT